METLFKKIMNEFSINNSYEHMNYLVNDIGERMSGTDKLNKAAAYIKDKMIEYGLDARIDCFPMYQSYPISAELRVESPETRIISAEPICHSASTLPEGIYGELIYAGAGGYDDYKDLNVEGKIVLTEMNWSPGRPEKARIANELGVKALIIMNWGKAEGTPVIQMGGTKSQWGNPTPDTEKEIPLIPVLSISRASGEYLHELCKKGNVKVWLKSETERKWITANQPIGYLKCGNNTDDYIVLGAHIDAWGKTSICNSSGNGLLLEFARILSKHRNELKRNVEFLFWDGHEVAEGAGSTWYVDKYWRKINKSCIAYLNVDTLAILGSSIPSTEGQPELKPFLINVVKDVWGQEGKWSDTHKGGGDTSFYGIGVPYTSFMTEYTGEKLKELNYAFYSPWLHTDTDTIDKIDKKLYLKHAEYFMELLIELCNRPLVPYDPKLLCELVKSSLNEIQVIDNGKHDVIWKEVYCLLDTYDKEAAAILEVGKVALNISNPDKREKTIEAYNKCIIKVERYLSNVIYSMSGRYGQDPCCSVLSGNFLPLLHYDVERLNKIKPGSHEFNMIDTKLLKDKNKLIDAIQDSMDEIETTLDLIHFISEENNQQ